MGIKITLEFANMAEAAAFLAGKPFNDPLPAAMQAPNVPPAGASNGAALPMAANPAPAVSPLQPAPSAPLNTPAPPPAPPAPPAGKQYTAQTIAPLLQQFAVAFKAAGMKAAFAKFGLTPQVSALDQNGLNTMGDYVERCLAAQQMLDR